MAFNLVSLAASSAKSFPPQVFVAFRRFASFTIREVYMPRSVLEYGTLVDGNIL